MAVVNSWVYEDRLLIGIAKEVAVPQIPMEEGWRLRWEEVG
jgi:hypothetical protein